MPCMHGEYAPGLLTTGKQCRFEMSQRPKRCCCISDSIGVNGNSSVSFYFVPSGKKSVVMTQQNGGRILLSTCRPI